MTLLLTCEDCPETFLGGKFSRFCEQCRAKRRTKPRKWECTPAIDARIAEIYRHPDKRTQVTLAQYAAQLGWPRWVLSNRAQALGLSKKHGPDHFWTQPETDLLEKHYWKGDLRISAIFRANGFSRSKTAIQLKRKRMDLLKCHANGDVYTARNLAQAFGVDSHIITRWIKTGALYARYLGTERTERNGGDMWQIMHADVRAFVINNPMLIDLRKVDPLWFIDLLANTKSLNSYELERGTRSQERAA